MVSLTLLEIKTVDYELKKYRLVIWSYNNAFIIYNFIFCSRKLFSLTK